MIKKIHPKLSRHCMGTLVTEKPDKLFDNEGCIEAIRVILDKHKVVQLGEQVHVFPNKSFTILVALSESHISIHTWPERHTVQLDVFLCNYMNDNTEKCQEIYDDILAYFKPAEFDTTIVERS